MNFFHPQEEFFLFVHTPTIYQPNQSSLFANVQNIYLMFIIRL